MSIISATIDNQNVKVEEGTTILEAAKKIGINIPTLCSMPSLDHYPSSCRVCVCEVEGVPNLQPSCTYEIKDGMIIRTNTHKVREARKLIVELLLTNHPAECTICVLNGNCELQKVAGQVGLREIRFDYNEQNERLEIDNSSPSITRDMRKCIHCHKCVTVCEQVQTVNVLSPTFRGNNVLVSPAFNLPIGDTNCTNCGQCVNVCPVGALVEKDDIADVWKALQNPEKHVIVQEAPAIRAALGEEFGMPPGTLVTGKMIAALRRLGFDKVFDTNFSADLTIMEEGHEFLKRVNEKGTLPLITSCSPGWIKFIEHFFPEYLDNVSTCKSPQQMFGSMAKTYYAEYEKIDPKDIVVVSIMPCTAKKFEAKRPEMCDSGFQDVDYVLTTRELARMIKEANIDFINLKEKGYDDPMGEYTGAATIFGATGGVMEAALRTVYAVVTGKNLPDLNITAVRGLEGVKEASVEVGNLGKINVAIAHGLGNARKLLDKMRAGEADYHFIEIMACPGGCVGGGGQPKPFDSKILELRAGALYEDDSNQKNRQSHENLSIIQAYETFLKEPLGHKSHKLLHTQYTKRGSKLKVTS